MKLGEALVKEAFITKQQLDQALERQIQFGGRIGTNLVELRFIDEDKLSKFIGKFFKLPSVTSEMVASIPEEVLNLVSKDIVEKYRIIPFKIERKRLHVAMLNPKEIKDIDELRFITGYDIIPYVITELRLLHALEKYYGIRRDRRYISLVDRFDPDVEIEETSIEKIKIAFTEVKEPEEIAGILLQEANRIASRVALFSVKGKKVVGWKGRGLDVSSSTVIESESSIFTEPLKNKNLYRGPVLNIKGNESLIEILSGTPQDALIMPINIREKLIALFYIDNGNASVLNANVSYISRLASMAALAFEVLILKKRILDM
jgi:hypothetical protein